MLANTTAAARLPCPSSSSSIQGISAEDVKQRHKEAASTWENELYHTKDFKHQPSQKTTEIVWTKSNGSWLGYVLYSNSIWKEPKWDLLGKVAAFIWYGWKILRLSGMQTFSRSERKDLRKAVASRVTRCSAAWGMAGWRPGLSDSLASVGRSVPLLRCGSGMCPPLQLTSWALACKQVALTRETCVFYAWKQALSLVFAFVSQ